MIRKLMLCIGLILACLTLPVSASGFFPYDYELAASTSEYQYLFDSTHLTLNDTYTNYSYHQYEDYYVTCYNESTGYHTSKIVWASGPYELLLETSVTIGDNEPFWIHAEYESDNPILISNFTQLQFVENITSASYLVTTDISMLGESFEPIASFSGDLDIGGYTISDMLIESASADQHVGMFASAGGATIHNGTIDNFSVDGWSHIGILVGLADDVTVIHNVNITGCSVGHTLYPAGNFGGVVGSLFGASSIYDCVVDVTVNGADRAGGIAGYTSESAIIHDCIVYGTVTGIDGVGGIVGRALTPTTIYNVLSYCNVSGEKYAGGVVGYSYGGDISKSASFGSFINNTGIGTGGLVGRARNSDIDNSYSTSDVYGTQYSGGLIGLTIYDTHITDSYSVGNVSGTSDVGGFIGYDASDSAVITSSYWDVNTSSQTTSDGGTGKTTSEMREISTYIGWDFDDTWIMYYYPIFRRGLTITDYTILVSVYDESTGEQITPDDVSVYDFDSEYSGTVDTESTFNISTVYDRVVISASADGYYDRIITYPFGNSLIDDVNMYLIDTNETVVYDTIQLTDVYYSYDYTDVIVEISKPMENGTEVVYSSYLDFSGATSTYFIAADQYIITIITPDSSISYGWLSPDPDGTVDVILTTPTGNVSEDWFEYDIVGNTLTGVITMLYYSDDINYVTFEVSAYNGTEVYETFVTTDNGIFQYTGDNTSEYYVHFEAVDDNGRNWNGTELISFVGDGVQPERVEIVDDSAPEWVTDIISMFFICISMFILSRVSMVAACAIPTMLAGYFWYIGNLHVGGIVITMLFIITISAFVSRGR